MCLIKEKYQELYLLNQDTEISSTVEPSALMVNEPSEYFRSDGARAVAVSNVCVCFHGLV